MVRLLRDLDYLKLITTDDLDTIIDDDNSILLAAEQAAQEEMISYLAQRYIINQTFTDTTTFSTGATYYGKNLVEYTAPTYDDSYSYNVNDHVVLSGYIYTCILSTTGQTSPATATTNWSAITEDKSLYFLSLPCDEFSINTTYNAGDVVWYLDKYYTANKTITGTRAGQSKNLEVQFISTSNPLPDNSPDWNVGATYSVSGIYPEDSTVWTKGDNRSQQTCLYLIDTTLYHLYSRINPRNIPELRLTRYDNAIDWLQKVAAGKITANIPQIIIEQGNSIRWGSNPKNNNFY